MRGPIIATMRTGSMEELGNGKHHGILHDENRNPKLAVQQGAMEH